MSHESAPIEAEQNETLYINNLNERVPLAQLKEGLRVLCSRYGTVRDVAARKSLRRRGQAFVVFDSVKSAARAMPHLHNLQWHEKPMRVAFARTRSDINVSAEKLRVRKQKRESQRVSQVTAKVGTTEAKLEDPRLPRGDQSGLGVPDRGEPNNVLFLERVPEEVTLAGLKEVFENQTGFVEVRMFAVKHVAFVEFDSVEAATAALDRTNANVGRMTFAKK